MSSWIADTSFIQDLESHYDGTAGEQVVKVGQYAFEDEGRNKISLKEEWGRKHLAGRRIFMRAILKRASLAKPSCSTCILQYIRKGVKECSSRW